VRRIGGAVKLETKGMQSFNRAGPLRGKINWRKQFINGDAKRMDGKRGARWRKKCSYVAVSLKNCDNNQANATNKLKILRCVKTERNEREKTKEMCCSRARRRKKKGREKDRWIQWCGLNFTLSAEQDHGEFLPGSTASCRSFER